MFRLGETVYFYVGLLRVGDYAEGAKETYMLTLTNTMRISIYLFGWSGVPRQRKPSTIFIDGGHLPESGFYNPCRPRFSTEEVDIFSLGSIFYTIMTHIGHHSMPLTMGFRLEITAAQSVQISICVRVSLANRWFPSTDLRLTGNSAQPFINYPLHARSGLCQSQGFLSTIPEYSLWLDTWMNNSGLIMIDMCSYGQITVTHNISLNGGRSLFNSCLG
jgi:hypothetical protein